LRNSFLDDINAIHIITDFLIFSKSEIPAPIHNLRPKILKADFRQAQKVIEKNILSWQIASRENKGCII